MIMRIKEFAEFTGVSIRTLRYYDDKELLKPAFIDDESGYRYYDMESVLRMQEILFYRELDFSLNDIKRIMDSPDYDRREALKDQKELLLLKRGKLEQMIAAIDDAMEGRVRMGTFDNKDFESYKEEVKEKWGKTEAYAEYEEKSKAYSKRKHSMLTAGLDNLMKEFALYKQHIEANEYAVQLLVKKLQEYITVNYYTCTMEILAGLGKMYVADERFRKNIDKHGEGTAEYICRAIEIYCKNGGVRAKA